MYVEKLGVEESREERIPALLAVVLLDLQEDMLVHIVLVDVPGGGQEGLDSAHVHLAGKQPEDVVADVVVHFRDDLPG